MTTQRQEVQWVRKQLPRGHGYVQMHHWQQHCIGCGKDIAPGDMVWQNYRAKWAVHDACSLPKEGEEK